MAGRTRSKALIIGLGALSAAALALTLGFGGDEAETTKVEAPTVERPAATEPGADERPALVVPTKGLDPIRRSLRVGDQRVYAFDMSKTTVLAQGGQEVEMPATVGGTWTVTVADLDAGRATLRCELKAPSHSMPSSTDEVDVRHTLSTPFYVTLAEDGRVDAVHMPSGLPGTTRTILKTIVALTQVALPEGADASWTVEESDPVGDYTVSYVRASALDIVKHKDAYLRVASVDGMVPSHEVGAYELDASVAIALDADGQIRDLDETETLAVALRDDLMRFKVVTRSTLRLQSTGRDGKAAARFAADWDALKTGELADSDRFGGEDMQRQHDTQRTGGATYAELLEAFRATPADAWQAQAKLLAAFESTLRLEPQRAADMAAEVRASESEELRSTLMGALSGAGTPQSQAALIDLAKDAELDAETRRHALTMLGMADAPTAETTAALLEVLADADGDDENAAALALGANVNKTRAAVSELEAEGRTKDAVETLIARLGAAQTDAERALYLAALGNTGDPRALESLLAYVAGPEVSLRAVATAALRFIPGASVDATLVEVFTTDSTLLVKLAALDAMRYRDLDVFTPVILTGLAEGSEQLRVQVVGFLGTYMDEIDGAFAALEAASQGDPSEQVRVAAAEYVQSVAEAGPSSSYPE